MNLQLTTMKPTTIVTNGRTFHKCYLPKLQSQMDDTAYKMGTFSKHDPEHTWQAGPGKNTWLWKTTTTTLHTGL